MFLFIPAAGMFSPDRMQRSSGTLQAAVQRIIPWEISKGKFLLG